MVPSGAFLQTERWREFQLALGRDAFFVSGRSWRALLVAHPLALGKHYLYCPRGPAVLPEGLVPSTGALREFFDEMLGQGKVRRSVFCRWDPPPGVESAALDLLRTHPSGASFRDVPSVQPQRTLLLDFSLSDAEVLSGMHPKTRYNIGLAGRRGVSVRRSRPEELERDRGAFWDMLSQTSRRNAFTLHERAHYTKLLEIWADPAHEPEILGSASGGEPFARLYLAEFGGQALAGAIVVFYGGVATYLHGASASARRDLMAPYLLHWRIMEEARESGYRWYDLWGVDEANPRWEGLTRFKRGFGGEELRCVPSADAVLRRGWYSLYRVGRFLRRR